MLFFRFLLLTTLSVAVVSLPFNAGFCADAIRSAWTICDVSASLDARANDIVTRLTLTDKFNLTLMGPVNISLPGLDAFTWWSEATHGVDNAWGTHANIPATNFPLPITTSCAFNRSLWGATGNQIGREARAQQNNGRNGNTFWAPVINIVRETRWGRNCECAGEDPFASGAYARAFVTGFQTAKEAPYPMQASATCKHFVANEYEGHRSGMDVIVSAQDLADSYLPPFQACVEEGKVSGMMCAYNSVNGEPCCANFWLLNTLLRQAWSFDGYVTSDCDAEYDAAMNTRYPNSDDAVKAILHAGTDVNCGIFMQTYAPQALANGTITEEDLNVILRRQFRLRLRLGHFDPPSALDSIGMDQICTPYSLELARDAGRQSAVLAKNIGGALPLTAASFTSVMVIGPLIDLSDTVKYYGSYPCNGSFVTPLHAVQEHIATAIGLAGVLNVTTTDTSGVAAAAAAAATADLVLLTIGSDLTLESEGKDRTVIDFSPAQVALVAAVTAAAKGVVVALVFSGGAMDVSILLANPKIVAIVLCGQPSIGVEGTLDAVFGRTLDGRAVAMAGRMSQTTYPAEFVNEVDMYEFGMRPGPSAWPPFSTPGRTYRFYTGVPVLPYGFGLSYTSWLYTPIPQPSPAPRMNLASLITTAATQAKTSVISHIDLTYVQAAAEAHAITGVIGHIPLSLKETVAHFYVNVTNTGAVDSDDVVLGFLVPPGAGVDGVPLQELFGFERVFVPAGQTVTVYLGAQGVRFTQADKEGIRRVLRGEYTVRFGVAMTAAQGMGFAELKVVAQARQE